MSGANSLLFRAPLLPNRPADFKCGQERGDDSGGEYLDYGGAGMGKTENVTISGGWKPDFSG